MSVNEKLLIEALSEGKSKAEAGRIAGSKAKNPTKIVNSKFEQNPDLSLKLKKKMESKMKIAIKNMTENKAKKSSFKDLMKSIEIAQKIVNVEEGKPTEIRKNISLSRAEILDRINELTKEREYIELTPEEDEEE